MAEFPLFVELEDVPCLVVGAGKVALRKIEALLPCRPRLTVVAPQVLPDIAVLASAGLFRLVRREFQESDLEGQRLAAAASEDRALNCRIAQLCKERGIWVDVVNDQEACTCKFPAVVRRGRLTVGISTGGASPAAARLLKERVASALPPEEADLAGILDFLASTREMVKARLPEAVRGQAFTALADRCMALGRGLDEGELEGFFEEAAKYV